MPLFFLIAEMFHPKKLSLNTIRKKDKTIVIPYFLWALILYSFWISIGKHYGESSELPLSNLNNFIDIFSAQGDKSYMDWGNPLLFIISGATGSLFFTSLFKLLPLCKPLIFWGKNTIVILASHLKVLTFIKLVLIIILGSVNLLNFETIKILITVGQLMLLTPLS